jgi:hypothetical protein
MKFGECSMSGAKASRHMLREIRSQSSKHLVSIVRRVQEIQHEAIQCHSSGGIRAGRTGAIAAPRPWLASRRQRHQHSAVGELNRMPGRHGACGDGVAGSAPMRSPPNSSIERTSNSSLRLLFAAAHV